MIKISESKLSAVIYELIPYLKAKGYRAEENNRLFSKHYTIGRNLKHVTSDWFDNGRGSFVINITHDIVFYDTDDYASHIFLSAGFLNGDTIDDKDIPTGFDKIFDGLTGHFQKFYKFNKKVTPTYIQVEMSSNNIQKIKDHIYLIVGGLPRSVAQLDATLRIPRRKGRM